jgi:molybdate transport system regulatory protein
MRISARNQISGVVELIERGRVNAEIFIKLKSGYTLVSNITKSAADSLSIKIGDEVTAIFKSSSVLLTTDLSLKISGRNKLQGKVESIHMGEVNAELVVDVGNSDKIAAVITTASVKNLDIKVGSDITAIIKASDLMIGK